MVLEDPPRGLELEAHVRGGTRHAKAGESPEEAAAPAHPLRPSGTVLASVALAVKLGPLKKTQ